MRLALKVFLFILSFVIAITISLAVAGLILEDRIVASTIDTLNKQLNAQLKVKQVTVSLIKGFPRAVVTLKGVEIFEGSLATPHELEPGLLSIDEVDVGIGLLGVLRKEFNLEQVVLRNGWINLYYDSKGKGNFEIFNSTDQTPSSWILNLDALILDNINVSYIDLRTGWIFKGLLHDTHIGGRLAQQKTLLNIKSSISMGVLRQGSFYYVRNQKASVSTSFLLAEEHIDIMPSSGRLGPSKLNFSGNISLQQGGATWVDISGHDFGVESLVSFLSQHNIAVPSGTKTRGSIAFNLSIRGFTKEEKPYHIAFDFNTSNLEINLPEKPTLMVNLLKGTFTNGSLGKPESSEVDIEDFSLKSGSSTLSGSLKVKNLTSPLYHLKSNQLIYIPDFLNWGVKVPLVDGIVNGTFEALGIIDNLESITLQSFENSKFYSTLDLHRLAFERVGSIPDLKEVTGSVKVSNQDISNAKIEGLLFGSKFEADIQATNATALVFGNSKTSVSTSIVLDSLNTLWLSQIVSPSTPSEPTVSSWDRINSISGDIFIDKLVHNQFEAHPISASFYTKSDNFYCNSFLARTCGGMLTGKFRVTADSVNELSMAAELDADALDINQLFRSFNNFGQTTITSKNLFGELIGSMAISAPLNGKKLDFDRLESTATLRLVNGKLVDLEPLKSLSRFIQVDELMDIKFDALENTLRIKDKVVVIPEMVVNSSALNLSVSGTHSFAGEYQYRVQVLLSDVLFGKASNRKEQNREFGEVIDDGSGRAKLHLKLEGNNDSFKVSYDAASARETFRQNLQQERILLKEILREEFSFLSRSQSDNDSIIVKADSVKLINSRQPNAPKKKKEETQKFTIEWD